MSLRARLEGKQRRKARLPVLVGDLGAAATEVATLRAALGKESTAAEPSEERLAELRSQLEEAVERQSACVAEVELQALPDDEWEAVFGPLEPDERGHLDLRPIHAVLLAASCTDPELQDVDWWTEQLARPAWSDGDKAAISSTLLDLNCLAPRGLPGKG